MRVLFVMPVKFSTVDSEAFPFATLQTCHTARKCLFNINLLSFWHQLKTFVFQQSCLSCTFASYRIVSMIAALVFQCLTGQATGYLAEDCQLVADVSARRLRSVDSDVCRSPHVQHLRRPMLRSCRSTAMELAANQSKTVLQSGTIQAFVKDIPV